MTQAVKEAGQSASRLQNWISRIDQLIQQIDSWAQARGWATARSQKTVNERSYGQYTVPILRVRLPTDEIHVLPVALDVMGTEGRIDIEAFPALNRVKLISRDDRWEIYTDSNVPLRQPWTSDTFAQLANDLLA